MHVLAINGSPRRNGNTSTLIRSMLEGAREAGAETTEAHLHSLNMKGCMGCLSCRHNYGVCAQKDELSPYLEMVKTSDALIFGCPIYMYRISGQMKLYIDRTYSLYTPKPGGGYNTAVPPGKRFALVVSQGAPGPEQYHRSIRWLAGMAGSGHGMQEAGRIVHADSNAAPATAQKDLLAEAAAIGRRLAGGD
jgi:multimeric flavodoxin WrbA